MRRVLAILLMLLLPLQMTWAAAAALHGHFGNDEAVAVFHYHDDDHHSVDHREHDDDIAGLIAPDLHDSEHHDGHVHPVFTMFVVEPRVNLGVPQPEVHPPWPVQSFTSHIPPVFDRPPLALG